ncbi:hypothetical protein COO91_01960 [Nostoc flagelliforme CCNUN1]|uniref:Uncharacterized protein n=1 Tax=Nostoc flagelliforme CCNUN1 TaxID=2038116 RepID=A0A2K8SKV1_9NOSO|nr:hypothetical protein COO91_01960 [Nostoc flagelliforme CCNUN1]
MPIVHDETAIASKPLPMRSANFRSNSLTCGPPLAPPVRMPDCKTLVTALISSSPMSGTKKGKRSCCMLFFDKPIQLRNITHADSINRRFRVHRAVSLQTFRLFRT